MKDKQGLLIIHLQVNDALVLCNTNHLLQAFKDSINHKYSPKWTRKPTLYLRIKLHFSDDGSSIKISQPHQIFEYVVEGGFKEGYNGTTAVLPEATSKSDTQLVSSIITIKVDEDNFTIIKPCQDSAKRMWRALLSAHQNNTAGGRYMHLRSMMTTRAGSDEKVKKLIGTMDVIRQRLMNVCPEGNVSIDDLYVSSLISALPESWTSVTTPLELQSVVTAGELKKVLRGHLVKMKNKETSMLSAPVAM